MLFHQWPLSACCPSFLAETLGTVSDWGCRDLSSASSASAHSGQPGNVSGQHGEEGGCHCWGEMDMCLDVVVEGNLQLEVKVPSRRS